MPSPPEINYIVEGTTDAAVARTLIHMSGAVPGIERVMRGKTNLLRNLPKYNAAAEHYPWLAIRDLDQDAECAPTLRNYNLPQAASLMCFRIAVREAESWLMADRETFAEALGVSIALVPDQPEAIDDPKLTIVSLARRSRKRNVRLGLVPEEGAGISIGPEYAAWMVDFAHNHWNPKRAAAKGTIPSLAKAILAVERLVLLARARFIY